MGLLLEKTDYPTLDPDVYDAQLTGIRPFTGDFGPALSFDFVVLGPHEVEGFPVSGLCPQDIKPGNKADRWISTILGRPIEIGEKIDTETLVALNWVGRVQVTTKKKFSVVQDVLPPKKVVHQVIHPTPISNLPRPSETSTTTPPTPSPIPPKFTRPGVRKLNI